MNFLVESIFKAVDIIPTEEQIGVITSVVDGGKTDATEKADTICRFLDIDGRLYVKKIVYNILTNNTGYNIPVSYSNMIIGYTDSDGDVVNFLQDNKTKELLADLFKNNKVNISYIIFGVVDENGGIKKDVPISFNIITSPK